MKSFFVSIRNITIAGFFFLLPIIVIFVLLAKVWKGLTSVGARIAATFGISSIAGFKGSHVIAGLLILMTCFLCGLLVRISFVAAFSGLVERWMSRYVPGYDSYKAIAEEKLQHKARLLPYASALVRQHECWLPAYIIEQDPHGNYVIFLPEAPDTSRGRILLAREGDVRPMAAFTANQLDASLKNMGKGLLSEFGSASDSPQMPRSLSEDRGRAEAAGI